MEKDEQHKLKVIIRALQIKASKSKKKTKLPDDYNYEQDSDFGEAHGILR